MSVIRHVASAGATHASQGTTPCAYPSGLRKGDLLVMMAGLGSTTMPNHAGSPWTQLVRTAGDAGTANPSFYVAYKIADGTESGSVSLTHTNNVGFGGMSCFRGVDQITPIDATPTINDMVSGSGAITAPTLTTTRSGCALLFIATNATTGNSATPQGSFAEILDANTLGAQKAFAAAYVLDQAAGATGTVTGIQFSGTGRRIGYMIPIRPAMPPNSIMIGA